MASEKKTLKRWLPVTTQNFESQLQRLTEAQCDQLNALSEQVGSITETLRRMESHEVTVSDWEKLLNCSMQLETQIAKLRTQIESDKSALSEQGEALGQSMETQIAKLRTQIESDKNALSEQGGVLRQSIESVSADIVKIKSFASNTNSIVRRYCQMADVRFERKFYNDFPVCASEEYPDFASDFKALVKGLDEESVRTVVLGIKRIKQIQSCNNQQLDVFSRAEKERRSKAREQLTDEIIQLSEDCWYWRGMMLPVNWFEACVFHDRCGLGELEHIERLTDGDIIDAGAFIGDSALIFSPLTQRKVYSFEPSPDNFSLLEKTVELNRLSNVVPCPCALGDAEGTIDFSICEDTQSGSTMVENAGMAYSNTVKVQCTTLDAFVKEHSLKVALIKTDVEGAEQALLRGAMETIKTQRPALLISIYHNADDFFHIKPMLEALELGYRFKIRRPMTIGGKVMLETQLVSEVEQ